MDGNFLDASGNGNNGSIFSGSPTLTSGISGGAYHFDGNDGISVGNLDFSGEQYTVSLWMRTTAPAVSEDWRMAIAKGNTFSGDMTLELFIGDGRPAGGENGPAFLVWQGYAGLANPTVPTVNARDGAWHMVTATYTSGDQKLFVDGCLGGTDSYVGPLPLVTEPVVIGGFDGFGVYQHPWIGDLDEVSIYTRVLDAAKVQQLYELYRPLTGCPPALAGQP